MNVRKPVIAFGSGITAFLVFAVAVTLLAFPFSGVIGGLIGLSIGPFAGIAVAVLVLQNYDDVSGTPRWVTAAFAGFGNGIFATYVASIVTSPPNLEITLAIGTTAGVLAVVLAVVQDRRQ